MFIVIVKVTNNRIVKYQDYPTLPAASAHLNQVIGTFPGAFIWEGNYSQDLFVNGQTVTVVPLISPIIVQIEALKKQLSTMEGAQYMSRGERESWRQLLVFQASIHQPNPIPEPALYATLPFYRRIKDADELAISLRAQINVLEDQL
jgi:hypothetical protein